eukprot:m.58936 g.58936  ORF g.58936 m.58936 type:complete len:284 (+) comp34846_c0_seq8:25-876(+)
MITVDASAPVDFSRLSLTASLLLCLSLAVLFVGSLYLWPSPFPRDHPNTIKKRCASVLISSIASILVLWTCSSSSSSSGKQGLPLYRWLGFKSQGLTVALVYPLALTMILFLGPLSMIVADKDFYVDSSPRSFVWWRNFVIAPLSEEFVFRACMLPLLLPHLGSVWSVLICPLFFGVAHLHHVREQLIQRRDLPASTVWLNGVFQLCYTSVFGAYSAWLFIRTGHLIAPVICHAFCNFMGFPDFGRIYELPRKQGALLSVAYVAGAIGFIALLNPLTSPKLFL